MSVLHDRVELWLSRDPDADTRAELAAMLKSSDDVQLGERFSGRLEFGTAGLRGVVGAGPAMMNRLVIWETSLGLGHYLLAEIPDAAEKGVVVAYDGRLDSRQFAADAASAFAALGIKVYLTPDVAATPVAAWGVITLNAAAGVVVTASHNPPQYNGYKVYWSNGAQIIPPQDAGIANAIEVAAGQPLPVMDFQEAVASGLVVILDTGFYQDYIDTLRSSSLFSSPSGEARNISVAYTAMHGVGAAIAEQLLAESGFTAVYSVASQREPDGNFPTVAFPNPEEPGAMDAVIALAQREKADLACANDPDADRLAVAVRTPTGDYQMLSGDMIGVLLGNYLLQKNHEFTPIVCTTIVSSRMLESIARQANAQFHTTLTGFKWLANVALSHEDSDHQFLFAYEEALGYAPGRQVRDKDGLAALLAFAQMTAELAEQGMTVLDQLEQLYRRHGIYLSGQRSIALASGVTPLGDSLRKSRLQAIAGQTIDYWDDLVTGIRTHANGEQDAIDLPTSDVLIYALAGGARVIVRPSGTEPKVKCYYEVIEEIAPGEDYSMAMSRARKALASLMDAPLAG
ncbi:MAG: phospho-sugar mutase [Halioglobus sp.]